MSDLTSPRGGIYLAYADGLAIEHVFRHIREFVQARPMAGKTVLDFGCGSAPYRTAFEAAGARYIAADIDGTPDLIFEAGRPLPLDDASVDYVVSFQVLEHVRDVPLYLREAYRLLKPGGELLLSTHGVWPYHPHPTDFWRWTRDGLRLVIADADFDVRRMVPICGPAAWMPMFALLVGQRIMRRAWFLLAPINIVVNVLASIADWLTPRELRETNAAIFMVEARRA